MKALSKLCVEHACALEGLLFDLDDTVLEDGKLREDAYSALFRLRESGLRLVALTGRPASWAEMVARMWPVEAAIAENGPLGFRSNSGRLLRFDSADPSTRATRRQRLDALVSEARRTLPGLLPADDVGGRVSDFTFDIGEHNQATESEISKAIALAEAHGARTTRSSVHLHFTYDRMDKATGALSYLVSRGVDATTARQRFAFIGDSENDAPCFAAFATTVGVANLSGDFSIPPKYITQSERARGFVEFSDQLCALRRSLS